MSALVSNRVKEIKSKGFNMTKPVIDAKPLYNDDFVPVDFSRIKVGTQTLEDAVLELGDLKKIDKRLADKRTILEAIHKNDLGTMRDVSNFFYRTSGIYRRLCEYLAYMYRYD